MSVSIDISGLGRERIAVVPSPLAELGMALHALAEPGHHPGLQGWATGVTARLDPHLADRMCEADFLWRTTFSDLFLPYAGIPGGATLPGASFAEELDLLDKLTDEQFVDAALEFTCALPYDAQGAGALGDTEARRRALELAAARGPRQVRFTTRLLDDPPRIRAWLRQFLEDCDEAFFAETWSRLRHQLAADARHKTELLRHKGLAEALASVSPAVVLDEAEGRITVDKMGQGRTTASGGLLLVPTSLGWPHLMVLHRYGWQPVLHYPVGSPQPVAPPSVEQLTLRMTALSHPVRMRLCRSLARSAFTTSELAQTHGMTAPEISRHVAVLKKAGLITTRRRGRYVLHQLDVTMVARLGSDFLEGILR
jgi:DNA-binding transcriptional ArsR family regulator